jgi:hypothetical protein
MPNARRAARTITETIRRLQLDLRGLVVLTEAGSNAFAVTPAIAAAAGARRVLAVALDSRHGRASDVRRQALEVAGHLDAGGRIEFLDAASPAAIAEADIVTNLGFVRPIDASFVRQMKTTAVVPLMCEAWEVRPGDVDLEACRAHGIAVAGTNEHQDLLPIFSFCGLVAVRLLLDAALEIRGQRIAILGWDAFATEIESALAALHATVIRPADRATVAVRDSIRDADVVLVADYESATPVVADAGLLTPADVAKLAPGATVVQFAGGVDAAALATHGVQCFPGTPVEPRRMAYTLAVLGPTPVIWLHGAGLKIGELLTRARLSGMSVNEAIRHAAAQSSLVQPLAGAES